MIAKNVRGRAAMKKLLSLFSGCGGMDIGFEGNFICLQKEINETIHPDWISKIDHDRVRVAPTIFNTVFANDIRPDAKAAWVSYFERKKPNANEALWILRHGPEMGKIFFLRAATL